MLNTLTFGKAVGYSKYHRTKLQVSLTVVFISFIPTKWTTFTQYVKFLYLSYYLKLFF